MEIPLTNGGVVLIDDADAPLITLHQWWDQNGYAVRWEPVGNGRYRLVSMHREICITPGEVDHKNGNGLDNQRDNLRPATDSEQKRNSRPHKTWKGRPRHSQYKGVTWEGPRWQRGNNGGPPFLREGRWRAKINLPGRKQIRRAASSEIEAALIYNELAIQHFGAFARLNKI